MLIRQKRLIVSQVRYVPLLPGRRHPLPGGATITELLHYLVVERSS